jgi:hypothetical protein
MTDAAPSQSHQIPPEVLALAQRIGAKADHERAMVHLTQTGRMRTGEEAPWMTFTARQSIAVVHCAFDWRARTGPFHLEWIRDTLENGAGNLSVKALGLIPMARFDPSAALTRGQLIRYLAELPLAPDAMICNDWLVWRSLDQNRLSVSAGTGDKAAEVIFTLDPDGLVGEAFAERPRAVGSGFVPTPWRGRFSDYRLHKGRRLPFAAEVEWKIDGSACVVWQGRMESWDIR